MRRTTRLLLPLSILWGAQASAQPCEAVPATAIIDFQGGPGQYRLLRRGQQVPIGRFMDLLDGDSLQVLQPAGQLSVQLADRSLWRMGRGHGRRCVQRPAAGMLPNILRRFGELISTTLSLPWTGIGRGDDDEPFAFGLPDLAAGTAVISAGERRLALFWHGGAPPFSVLVRDDRGTALVREGENVPIYPRLLRLRPRQVAPGEYYVEVRDRNGDVIRGSFLARADDPALLNAGDPDSAVLAAGRLYVIGPNRSFDAFGLLSPYYDEEEANTPSAIMGLLTLNAPLPRD